MTVLPDVGKPIAPRATNGVRSEVVQVELLETPVESKTPGRLIASLIISEMAIVFAVVEIVLWSRGIHISFPAVDILMPFIVLCAALSPVGLTLAFGYNRVLRTRMKTMVRLAVILSVTAMALSAVSLDTVIRAFHK